MPADSLPTAHAAPASDLGTVHYARGGAIVTLTIDAPAYRNALSAPVREGIREGLRRADADDQVAAVILTGAGDKAFCGGINLKEMAAAGTASPPPGFMPITGRTVRFGKALIAAVNGIAFGGGFLLAQMADLLVAADHALFGMPEAKVGRGAPWSVPLSRMIPRRVWLELCLTGEPMTAERAYQIGFANAVVPASELLPTATAMAERIIANAPLTVSASREMVNIAGELGMTQAWDAADELFEPVYASLDAQEGPRAFQERRSPRWQGR